MISLAQEPEDRLHVEHGPGEFGAVPGIRGPGRGPTQGGLQGQDRLARRLTLGSRLREGTVSSDESRPGPVASFRHGDHIPEIGFHGTPPPSVGIQARARGDTRERPGTDFTSCAIGRVIPPAAVRGIRSWMDRGCSQMAITRVASRAKTKKPHPCEVSHGGAFKTKDLHLSQVKPLYLIIAARRSHSRDSCSVFPRRRRSYPRPPGQFMPSGSSPSV